MKWPLLLALLSPALAAPTAQAEQQAATCTLDSSSVIGHNADGTPQVSNLGKIALQCSVAARPEPIRPGEVRNGLTVALTASEITAGGTTHAVPAEVSLTGGGSDFQRDRVAFEAQIPLTSADLDSEARRLLASMDATFARNHVPPHPLTDQEKHAELNNLQGIIAQNRAGRFVLECSVKDGDRLLGVGRIELTVLFKGHFADILQPAPTP